MGDPVVGPDGTIYVFHTGSLVAYALMSSTVLSNSKEVLRPLAKVIWRATLSVSLNSTLALSSKGVLVAVAKSSLEAFDALNGNRMWTARWAPCAISRSPPVIDDTAAPTGNVIVAGNGGLLSAFSLQTGRPVWQIKLKGCVSSPMTMRQSRYIIVPVLAGAQHGFITAVALNGRPLWTTDLGSQSGKPTGGVLTTGGYITASYSGQVFLIDTVGKTKWTYKTEKVLADVAVDSYENVYLHLNGNGNVLFSIDRNGKFRWKSLPVGHQAGGYQRPLVSGDQVISTGATGSTIARSVYTGKLLWQRKAMDSRLSPLASSNGEIFVVSTQGLLHVLSCNNPFPAWRDSANSGRPPSRTTRQSDAVCPAGSLGGEVTSIFSKAAPGTRGGYGLAITGSNLVLAVPAIGRGLTATLDGTAVYSFSDTPDWQTFGAPVVSSQGRLVITRNVYRGSALYVHARDENYRTAWRSVKLPRTRYQTSPVVDDHRGLVYVLAEKSLVALSLQTGDVAWTRALPSESNLNPTIAENGVVYVVVQSPVTQLFPFDPLGRLGRVVTLWKGAFFAIACVQRPASVKSDIVVTLRQGTFVLILGASVRTIPSSLAISTANAVDASGNLFLTHPTGEVSKFQLNWGTSSAFGRLLWQAKAKARYSPRSRPVLGNSNVVVADTTGTARAYRASDGKPVWSQSRYVYTNDNDMS